MEIVKVLVTILLIGKCIVYGLYSLDIIKLKD